MRQPKTKNSVSLPLLKSAITITWGRRKTETKLFRDIGVTSAPENGIKRVSKPGWNKPSRILSIAHRFAEYKARVYIFAHNCITVKGLSNEYSA